MTDISQFDNPYLEVSLNLNIFYDRFLKFFLKIF
jgi:hypothetical protein